MKDTLSTNPKDSKNKHLNFSDFGLSNVMLTAIRKKGYEEPTPIQAEIIPKLLQSKSSILGQAQTGTGKTAAYSIPIIEKINVNDSNIQVLILAPTRELALQITTEINSFKGHKKIAVAPIYGGQSFNEQLIRIQKGVQIVIGTPGRVLDHLTRNTLNIEHVTTVVLDEADEMLGMGFIEDINKILSHVNENRQLLLFSATVPHGLKLIIEKYMGNYEHVVILSESLTTDLVEQIYFEISPSNRMEALCRIIDMSEFFYGIVFCNTKMETDNIASELVKRGFRAERLHGDASQAQREKILQLFKEKTVNILVSTDVAARGIDVSNLTHVVNYSLPYNPESYIHRIGRTGRAGRQGQAITFVSSEESRKLSSIGHSINTSIVKKNFPTVKEMLEIKINRIKKELSQILETNNFISYQQLAMELLEETDPKSLVAAMLRFSFQEQFEESSYEEIPSASASSDGYTNLFFAMGSNHGMTQNKIIETISKDTGIPKHLFSNTKVLADFSFFMVVSEQAKNILDHYENIALKSASRIPLVRSAYRKSERKDNFKR